MMESLVYSSYNYHLYGIFDSKISVFFYDVHLPSETIEYYMEQINPHEPKHKHNKKKCRANKTDHFAAISQFHNRC